MTALSCRSREAKAHVAGQIARAAAVFSIDEVVIFDDVPNTITSPNATAPAQRAQASQDGQHGRGDDYTGDTDPADYLNHVLTYLETPPYLRGALFPKHSNLHYLENLPEIGLPHHLLLGEQSLYREGVTVRSGEHGTSWIDAGTGHSIPIADTIPAGVRVTLRMGNKDEPAAAVAPQTPREESGLDWGFTTRRADCLSAVFTEAPFDSGYDVSVGVSHSGSDVDAVLAAGGGGGPSLQEQHILIMFGGAAGLESALAADDELREKKVTDVAALFDHWVSVVPGRGSCGVRTEEAVWIGLGRIVGGLLADRTKRQQR